MKRKVLILILALLPVFAYAQKAFEMEYYKGRLQGAVVELQLANGYIGGSKIVMQSKPKAVNFSPESGVADAPFILRCDAKARTDYFILDGMQDVFETPPAIITGQYHNGKQVVRVKFYRAKHR